MNSYTACGKYNPYLGVTTPCSGDVFHVFTQLKPREGYPTDDTEYDGGTVCGGHMPLFEGLANRSAAERGFIIVRSESVGTIVSPEGGSAATKEIESVQR